MPTTDATADTGDATSEKATVAVAANSPKPQVIKLRLESTSQREQINIPGAIRVARVEGAEATMSPTSGIIAGSPLEVTINGPRPVMLSISVVKIKDERYVQVVPTVKTDAGRSVPFTPKNLDTILMRTTKSDRNAADLVASQTSEKNRLQAYIDSPGNRPLATYKNAVARIKELGVQILESQQLATSLGVEVTATQELAKFADQLQQSCSIEIESANAAGE